MREELEHSLGKDTSIPSVLGVEKILEKKINLNKRIECDYSKLWAIESFLLNKISYFNESADNTQAKIAALCSKSRLMEAYTIEDAGMSYCAKMSLLSKTQSEQMLYSLFAQEEAVHLNYIKQFLEPECTGSDPFILLLKEVIVNGSRNSLLLVMQVLLEGWGIEHYRAMSQAATHKDLKKYLNQILLDEASHHGSGVVLFSNEELSAQEKSYIKDILAQFLYLVGCGPLSLINSIEEELGHLSVDQKNKIYKETDGEQESIKKLNIIKNLLKKAGSDEILKNLENIGCFKPQWPL